MKHFLQRVFYLEKKDTCVELAYYAFGAGCWGIEYLMPSGSWASVDTFRTYEEAYDRIRYDQPLLICEELL